MYRKELIYNEPERLTGNNKETKMNLLNEFLNEYPYYKHFKAILSNGFNKLLLKLNRSDFQTEWLRDAALITRHKKTSLNIRTFPMMSDISLSIMYNYS